VTSDDASTFAELRSRVGDVARFVASVARLLRGVATDPRVPRSAKVVAVVAAAYVVSPVDLIPDVLPVIGQLDDVWIISRALRHLLRTAGHDVVREHWDGTDEGFAALLFVAGVSS
jgi:uncharacterized membrane protein YkvA (DUF1232 family)